MLSPGSTGPLIVDPDHFLFWRGKGGRKMVTLVKDLENRQDCLNYQADQDHTVTFRLRQRRDTMVGIRELKAKLSGYMQEVKKGKTLVITQRGLPVGRLTPVDESLEEKMHGLDRSGFASWNGKKLKPGRSVAKLRPGAKSLSDIVSENRD